ncbi:hypothetical protein GCM10025867_50770 (plasmid) [Frondihabitans sucicola]|uniref:DUF2634 domain-containing protein n=1 Tax=Frondihabitans sucicola TaxID=1268041 RepID=A0ABN6Y730_9MICO|nr:hypothetical protein [Frondihabitans sucicola]BDZ52836.1 hypothetical protein GCM10025867_50770 [Frondihabitans sucicola]
MTTTTPASAPVITPHPEGTLVRLIRDSDFAGEQRSKGLEIEVGEFISADLAEDGIAFYWGNSRGGYNNANFLHEDVEVIRTAEQQSNRTLPSREDLLRALGGLIISSRDEDAFSISETGYDASLGAVEVVARTADGLDFTFNVFADNIREYEL